jgi:hypothetical protein
MNELNVYVTLQSYNMIKERRNKAELSRSCRASFKILGHKFGTKTLDKQTMARQTGMFIALLCNKKIRQFKTWQSKLTRHYQQI